MGFGAHGAAVVLGVVDVELRRFHSGRTAELLTPLPAEWTAKIAAEGLQAPEIARDRVLEDLIERAVPVLSTVLSYVGVTDVLDVIATSVLIYYLLLLIRAARARCRFSSGILVLVALLGIANLFHLYLLGTILQTHRRRRGGYHSRSSFSRNCAARSNRSDAAASSGWTAARRPPVRGRDPKIRRSRRWRGRHFCSRASRLGALIVIEQQSGLKEFCETGTTLDARLSAELLLSIFMPRSPLHDGAAIVREESDRSRRMLSAAGRAVAR